MHFKLLVISALVSGSLATPEKVQRRQAASNAVTSSGVEEAGAVSTGYQGDTDAENISVLASLAGVTATEPAVVSSLESVAYEFASAVVPPPESVLAAIMTAIPSSVVQLAQTNPAELLAGITPGVTPDWVSQLPTEAVAYIASEASVVNGLVSKHGLTHTSGILDALSSAQSELTEDSTSSPTSAPTIIAGATGVSNSTLTTTTASRSARTTGATNVTGTEASTGPARVTSNPAAKATGALAASLAGLVGVLGVAVAL